MYELTSPGWFKSLNGLPVIHHELPASFMDHGTSWALGRPNGLLFHYQAGTGADLYDVQIARTYPIIAFNVDANGQWRQYCDVRGPVPWHAYSVSEYFLGVEHAVLTANDFTDKMLENSAMGFAALTEYWEDKSGFVIPTKHVTHLELTYRTAQGAAGHLDIKPGTQENPNGHVDTLGVWPWSKYLSRILFHRNAKPRPGHPYPGHTLQAGSDEAGVLALKKRLAALGYKGFTISPHFGLPLENAVKAFQKKNKLVTDGVVGEFTWRTLWRVKVNG